MFAIENIEIEMKPKNVYLWQIVSIYFSYYGMRYWITSS